MIDPAAHDHAETVQSTASLSARERQVLELAAHGLTNHQIADRLGVTVHAVKFHLAATYQKLTVANRTEAAFVFLREAGKSSEVGR
jgi:DNA-binding NarL/FixJ family response regulator